tara:strand:+ start:1674 stop:2360 length:687 start_codon:yes stop_codon:yes gene_type:complete
MELSQNTLSVLKNFSAINQNILIKQGDVLKTISEARNVVATARVDCEFPQSMGIYDLNEFIGVLSLVDSPQLKVNDEYVTISDSTGMSKVKYFFSPEETLTFPQKDIIMPDADVNFTLTGETLDKIKKAASTLGHEEVSISSTSDNSSLINLSVVDIQNSTSNTFSMDIACDIPANATFNFVINISNLKLLPGDYDVAISSKLISCFSNIKEPVQYWIALEKTSKYGV